MLLSLQPGGRLTPHRPLLANHGIHNGQNCDAPSLQQRASYLNQVQRRDWRCMVMSAPSTAGGAADGKDAKAALPAANDATDTQPKSCAVCPGANVPSATARAKLFGVAREAPDEVEATVQGALPAWLSGSLLINGGGDYTDMKHMFDAFALVSKLRIEKGRAFGSQRTCVFSASHASANQTHSVHVFCK